MNLKAQIKKDSIEKTKDSIFVAELIAVESDTIKENQVTELNEVTILSTRMNRKFKNSPTRIETIDAEELEEKSNMKPANISMVLHESTGIQVQQTSATSGNASIRVQGLDGSYTQLLKDGYPNFGNFASGLSVLEIPPLDLKQVEVIKGPASTLYGGGAIAGVVNFISKTPKFNGEYNFLLNQSNIGQSNFGGYASNRNKKFGYTFLGLLNLQKIYDVDNDGFSEIPESNNFTINPRFFYYLNESTTFIIGNSFTKSLMKGGDLNVIAGNVDAMHTYFENNETLRNTTILEFEKKIQEKNIFKLKQSLSFFDRKINIPNYNFEGFNTNLFSEASYLWFLKNQVFVSGITFQHDNFKQRNIKLLNSKSIILGSFIQQTWDISDRIILENGLRIENTNYSNLNFNKNETFLLPRISALFKINKKLSSRITGGLGYKLPTIFTEQTETNQYQNILPLDTNLQAQKSIGGTTDINFKTNLSNELVFSINQMFFLTQINKPLVLFDNGINTFFQNAEKPILTQGFETNMKFIFKEDLKLFLGYTFTNARAKYLIFNQSLSLLPKNKLNMSFIYEKENNFKLGLEGFFTDKQFLSNGIKTPSFWEFGFMAEKTMWKNYSFFINFENFTDVRQSRYKSVVNEPINNPTFDEIWTHTEGATINGGIKLKF
ncbi:MAG: TonB-dependent receptor plug domain-containing protein [Solirubrobacteraceae bacterium]